MTWMVLAAAFGAGTVASFTDWLFMGVLFHDAYLRYPEVWWPREGRESRAIIASMLVGYIMSGAVVVLCALVGAHTIVQGLEIALLTWLAGPVVLLVTNSFFMKIDNRVTFAHALGWLARMALAGAAAGYVLGM